MRQPASRSDRIVHAVILTACLAPCVWLIAATATRSLGADPVEDIAHVTGIWSLRLLLITLALTPFIRFTGWHRLSRYRRTFGLCAFFYATLHVLVYLVFDQFFDWRAIAEDLLKRPPLSAGLAAFLLMVPLAATSSASATRRLGIHTWRRLHRLAYLAAAAGVFHYFWLVKQDISAPAVYVLVLALLLIVRLQPRKPGPIVEAASRKGNSRLRLGRR